MKSGLISILLLMFSFVTYSQTKDKPLWNEDIFSSLKFRSIGPALMSGRISDIAVHPKNQNTWIVAVSSGGVWKTENSGTTWKPVFDDQNTYSTGCVTIDQQNPNIVWVGTGENNGGRHIGYGDGIYKSIDGGNSFVNSGLKASEHISKIIVHPTNSDIIWVAAQGPLWSKGGERGVFKSVDGGKTWKQYLGDKEWVGATDLIIDPRNPDVLYAATWQRHRTIAAYMGGGPGTALYKSEDGGLSWTKLTKGLPTSNMGKIGMAISPQNPDVLYAAIELDRRTGGVYRSSDRGATWSKMSDAVSGATGPLYYQELYASPHQFDKIYLVDVRVQVSDDGGKTFYRMKEEHKHSDNHSISFRADDPNYLLIGTDGGIYESFDNAENWRFVANLPLTQFYKVAVDDAKPFYNVFGGTQDNSTEGGPSRTDNVQGIQNSDWKVVLDWDGHQPATEPGNPDIMYGQRQQGTLARIDMKTGEVIDIQPQPELGEAFERYNWDAPILVSPHEPKQIFFASQRLWKSNNRGDSWTVISGDLTRNQERMNLSIMGGTQGYDNPWDLNAMSNYNTITSIAESPKQRDLIYIGTDDGLIQITEDGGKTWRKSEISSIPGVPATSYINDIKADLYDANKAYIALDNHKTGDYSSYLYRTNDKGKTWVSMKSNLPEKTLVWRIVQDHVKEGLFFLGTEYGIYFTVNSGNTWTKMKGGLPPIPFRDLVIQKRENDLVAASFGRSFYILDDYSPLREINEEELKKEISLYPVKNAWWYIPRSNLGFEGSKGDQGAGHFVAPNPDFGAVITYYLKEDLKTTKEKRLDKEKADLEGKKAIQFHGWDAVKAEGLEETPKLWLFVKDGDGNIIRKIEGPIKKGIHRVNWDLRYPSLDVISLGQSGKPQSAFMVAPGKYMVSIAKEVNGVITELSQSQSFEVIPLKETSIKRMSIKEVASFWRLFEKTSKEGSALSLKVNKTIQYAEAIKKAITVSSLTLKEESLKVSENLIALKEIQERIEGNPAKSQMGEKNNPTLGSTLFNVARGISLSTYGPTDTNQRDIKSIITKIDALNKELEQSQKVLSDIASKIEKSGGPFVEKGF